MNLKVLFGVFVAVVAISTEVSGRCVGCGFGSGTDYCGSCSPQVVKPVPLDVPNVKTIVPDHDGSIYADCKDVKVKPVYVPRPNYIWKEPKPVPCDNSPLIPAPDHLHDFSQDVDYLDGTMYDTSSPCNPRPLYPVDPVSVSLVNRMQEYAATSLPEERLQYGFYKIPKELPNFRTILNIPEERLYTVERQIVELKSPKSVVKCNVGCEDILIEDDEPQPIVRLSYSDLGFVPEEDSYAGFITSCKHKQKSTKYISEGSSEEKESCGCH